MRKIVLLLCLTCLLVGCGPSKEPGIDPGYQIPEPDWTPEINTPVGNTSGFSGKKVFWEEHPLLSQIPQVEGDMMWEEAKDQTQADSYLIVSDKMLPQEARDFIALLKEAGFTLDSQFKERIGRVTSKVMGITYYARNAQGMYVSVGLQLYSGAGQEDKWLTRFKVELLPPTEIPPDAQPSPEDWNADGVRALVPAPQTPYWSASTKGPGEKVQVCFPYMTLMEMEDYAKVLEQAGYSLCKFERHEMRRYYYTAQDAQGNTAVLVYNLSEPDRAVLNVYPAGKYREDIWSSCYDKNEYIPAPDCSWFVDDSYDMLEIFLYGMDYQDALDYLQECDAFARSNGHVLTTLVKEQEANKLNIRFTVNEPHQAFDIPLAAYYLVYDPANTACPCKLVRPYSAL